jgi:UDP-N-acetylglucosamine 2-epimerase (non-hydrolysing)
MDQYEEKEERIVLVMGTRPNIVKIAPVWRELKKQTYQKKNKQYKIYLLHTGQHYSECLSELLLKQLGLPVKSISYLEGFPKGAGELESISWMIKKVGEWLHLNSIDKVVVFGDVNSTLAVAISASILQLPIIHVESGLRSYDPRMPEERNRILVDKLSDLLLTTDTNANKCLEKEGLCGVHVGNVMMDTLVESQPFFLKMRTFEKFNVEEKAYILMTVHRKENVCSHKKMERLLVILKKITDQKKIPVIFPAHPRTLSLLKKSPLDKLCSNFIVTEPLGYMQMMDLVFHCGMLITDSGGLQEEASYMGVPTITVRENTERPLTIEKGWNQLVSPDSSFFELTLINAIEKRMSKRKKDLDEIRKETGYGRASVATVDQIIRFQKKK